MVERQVFVTWYTPEEKLPEEGVFVIATISGKKEIVTYDHTLTIAEWYNDGLGWILRDDDPDEFIVHAWCNLEPYGGMTG